MNKNLFYLLPIFILLFSCRNSDNESDIKTEQEFLVKKISLTFIAVGHKNETPSSENNIYYTFEYDSNNRLIKKIGMMLPMPSSTGYNNYYFSKDASTIIEYKGTSATLKDISTDPKLMIPEYREDLILNNSNQIIEKNILYKYSMTNKKTKYFYNGKLLIKRETTYPNMPYDPSESWDYIETIVEDFTYDSNNNLQKIVTTSHKTGNVKSINKIKEITFGNYDTSKNPFVKLGILNDYFERSLSKNNFRSRIETSYNIEGNPYKGSENTWNYSYDSNGNLILE
ncbi:hypothetical protein [Elizabethkingia miricola]|uniref:hypothetical protein n=1 Tax=Elizabethkingia miricola TaxID=172045 RepID=UPI002597AA16|nr:hypothetical protein [uncultured Elizabethkingia sp.]